MPRRRSGRHRPSAMQMALMQRPASNAARVVFPWSPFTKDYSKNEFNPIATQGRVSAQEVDQFFNSLKAAPNYIVKTNVCLLLMIPLIMIGGFGLMVFLMISGSSSRDPDPASIMLPFLIMPLIMCAICGIACYVGKQQ